MKKLFFTFIFVSLASLAYNQTGSIENIQVQQRPDGSGLVDINFDLAGDGTNYFMRVEVSFNAGTSYSTLNSIYTTGDVGPINPGNGKQIVWDGLNSSPHIYTDQARVRLTAITGTFPNQGEPCPGTPTVTHQGKTYTTVLIGNQCWLRENLDVGTMITSNINQSNNAIIEKYCYGNDEVFCNLYGGLYLWNEAMNYVVTPGAQGLCPTGWHIPTDNEVKILEGTVDSQYEVGNPIWDQTGNRGFDAGKKLKSTNGWSANNGTDYFGFTGQASGYLSDADSFGGLNTSGYFITSDQSSSSSSYFFLRSLSSSSHQVGRSTHTKNAAFPIRCIKD